MKVLSESDENELLEELYNSYFNTKRENEAKEAENAVRVMVTPQMKDTLSLVDNVLFDHAENHTQPRKESRLKKSKNEEEEVVSST